MKKLSVARLGRSVGLKGEMKLHELTDFPEQFKKGAAFHTDRGELTIQSYNPKRGTVKFEGIDSPEEAKRYTNAYLYSDEERTKRELQLGEGEYFWFDIIGNDIYEEGKRLGKVRDIQRLPSCDYLDIATDETLIQEGLPKSFLLPFQDPFIKKVDVADKRIEVQGAKDILEAS